MFFKSTDKKTKKKNPIKWFFKGLIDAISEILNRV